jgi:hypothetical protein
MTKGASKRGVSTPWSALIDEGKFMRSCKKGSFLASVALAAPVIAASLATAETLPWVQDKVTAIAGELPPATRALRESLRRTPPPTLGQAGKRSFWRIRDQLRSIESTSGRLHNALLAGEGREETLPIYRRMITTVRDAARELNRIPILKPVEEHIETVAGVLKRLRPFYEKDPII